MYNVIIKSISDFKLSEGQKLSELLPLVEMQRLTLFIFSNLPKPLEILEREIDEEVLMALSDKVQYIKSEVKQLNLLEIQNKITKEQELLLIFYKTFLYHEKYRGSILSYDMEELLDYFKSYVVSNLEEELRESSVKQATTTVYKDTVFRVQDNKLVPTLQTLEHFNQFLTKTF
jgi:hypothetical protein